MSLTRTLCSAGIAGALLGGVLALTIPPRRLSASAAATQIPECKCDDDGSGNYKCKADQSGCIQGNQVCVATCAEQ